MEFFIYEQIFDLYDKINSNEIIEKDTIVVEDMIYEVRGVEVMLDSDLAKLYQVETKRINEAVKNNPDKFPVRYYFRLDEKEYNDLKSKISTSKGGSRKRHTAFTEQGIYMLATILKSNVKFIKFMILFR